MRFLFLLLIFPTFAFANEMPIQIGGSMPLINIPFVSVTICEPHTNRCKTIDKIVFDTGSNGLRIRKSALRGLKLEHVTTPNGETIEGCAEMAGGTGYWGPIAKADIHLGDEVASDASFQIADDSTRNPAIKCNAFPRGGQNGILGMGPGLSIPRAFKLFVNGQPFADDSLQPKNLISYLGEDANGFSVSLPPLDSSAHKQVEGKIIFGIGTRANNEPPRNASVCTVRSDQFMSLRHEGLISYSMLDTGSFAYILPTSQTWVRTCDQGYACPDNSLTQTVELLNTDHSTCAKVEVSVSKYSVGKEIAKRNKVFPQIANVFGGKTSSLFVLGVPFFYGRQVFYVLDGANSTLGVGPRVAF